jgi:hypothetical protein
VTQPIPPDWPDDVMPPADAKALSQALVDLIVKHGIEVPR